MKKIPLHPTLIAGLVLLATGCGAWPGGAVETSQDVSTVASPATGEAVPCDPGLGSPVSTPGCPEPTSGWVTVSDGEPVLTPFRTLGNDAEGRAYARERGVEFPFPNDYFDAADGAAGPVELSSGTLCTGVILVGYREPLTDRVVPCDELLDVAGRTPVPVAVWSSGGRVVQASELYRP